MIKRIFSVLASAFWIIFLFAVLSVICAYFLIEHYFPNISLNQLVFHIVFTDKTAVYAYTVPIILSILGITLATYLGWRWPIVFIPVYVVTAYHIYDNMPPVSDITEDKEVSAFRQLRLSFQNSKIYEDFYYVPALTKQTPSKNIIIIFAESIEKNFADETYWGENLIPNLSALSEQYTTISGYVPINGTNWTIASNASVLCGVPLRMQFRDALGKKTSSFFPNAVCLPDLLHKAGYYNVFLKGAYLDFVGTSTFLNEHYFDETIGRDELLAMNAATEDDLSLPHFIPLFGVNDTKMFDFAKQKLVELSKLNQPFFMSIENLDTHFPSGYVAPSCSVKYHDIRDAVKCSDKIIYDFIKWCQSQDFYDNTVIIVFGDHLMMNSVDIASTLQEQPNREIYNVIISKGDAPQTLHRQYAQFDWGATILDILQLSKTPRLGLGVSLLGTEPTLVEQLGAETLEDELLKDSVYYRKLLNKEGNKLIISTDSDQDNKNRYLP